MAKHWNIKNVILLTLIAVVCGILDWGFDLGYNGILLGLSLLGLKPFAVALTLGLWMIAGTLAACVLKKPGAACLGELLAAVIEMSLGGQWGMLTLLEGLIQGFGSEAGFALTGYRHYDGFGLLMASITGCIFTFTYDFFALGYGHYSLLMIVALFIARFGSLILFSGLLPLLVMKLLKRSQTVD